MSLPIIAITFDRHFFDLRLALKVFNLEPDLKLECVYESDAEIILSTLKDFELHVKRGQFVELEDYLKLRGVEKFDDLDHRTILRNEAADLNVEVDKGITLHLKTSRISTHFWEKQSKYMNW